MSATAALLAAEMRAAEQRIIAEGEALLWVTDARRLEPDWNATSRALCRDAFDCSNDEMPQEAADPADFMAFVERRIAEGILSLEGRSEWRTLPVLAAEPMCPSEFKIWLTFGGPRIWVLTDGEHHALQGAWGAERQEWRLYTPGQCAWVEHLLGEIEAQA